MLAGPVEAEKPNAEPDAASPEKLLRAMSDALDKAGSFGFHAEINFDEVLRSGQKLQYAGAVDVVVRPPSGVYVDYRDDLSAKHFWYDGKTGTLLDVVHETYSQAKLPSDIDSALAELLERYELALPLADLISGNHFETIAARALAWGYIGVHDVDGRPADHIAITGKDADLQIWIGKEGTPLPLKIVVTYKNHPMAPQYQAVLMDWKLGAKVSADTFRPRLPKGAQKVEFLVAEGRK
jgi:hypothetical protein